MPKRRPDERPPLRVVSVSGHALTRFREHVPDASAAVLRTAAELGIPMPSHLAHALAGRPRAFEQDGVDESEHRLHPSGDGIFVISPLPYRAAPDDGSDGFQDGFVRTYLRLVAAEQRRMAREWFLLPIGPLRTAFELGFEAGRAAGPEASAVEAAALATPRLLQLGPNCGFRDGRSSLPPRPAEPRAGPGGAGPVPTAATPPNSGAAAPVPSENPNAPRWTERALLDCHPLSFAQAAWEPDIGRWRPMEPGLAAHFLTLPHVGRPTDVAGVLVEPHGLGAALLGASAEGLIVRRVFSLPRDLRSDSPARPRVAPAPPAPPVPLANPAQPAVFLDEPRVEVLRWTPLASTQASRLGIPVPDPDAFPAFAPVAADALQHIVARVGWRLAGDRHYVARRDGPVLYLLAGVPGSAAYEVDRCARLPE